MPPVIANTTPLVALWVVEKLSLLRDLFEQVVIPPAVHAECIARTGTLGVLLLAKEKQLIASVRAEVERLQQAGLHLKPELVAEVLKHAHEAG